MLIFSLTEILNYPLVFRWQNIKMPHKEIWIMTIQPIAILVTLMMEGMMRAKSRLEIRLKIIRLAIKT